MLFIDAKAAQAIGVGKFAETAELLEAQRRLQFVSDFEECHGGIIAGVGRQATRQARARICLIGGKGIL